MGHHLERVERERGKSEQGEKDLNRLASIAWDAE
jgi:hypothetical protein